jgi:GT2 family glycosyltransferase
MSLVVCICTRDRVEHLGPTLDALLRRQDWDEFGVVVIDQSAVPYAGERSPRVRVIHDRGRGLSRARNIALRETTEDWLVFLDDDCLPDPGWARGMRDAIAEAPAVDFVSGHVGARNVPEQADEFVGYSLFAVEGPPRRVSGPGVAPMDIGFGVCFAVSRAIARRVGGWDERLGPGVAAFPASDDMDFNLRVLRAGGVALITPTPRAAHDQWRSAEQIVALYEGYAASWMGLCVKTLRQGHRRSAAALFAFAAQDLLRMAVTAVTRNSRTRRRLAVAKARGMARGLRAARRIDW